MSGHKQKRPKQEIICRCNNISRATLEEAIKNGCQTMNEIFDETTAGVGPCGGSCRRKIKPLLDGYLATGIFPEILKEDETVKVDDKKTS
jgi:NAD(P)H-nitrite reductase large subunit